jgi:transposase-like protein
MTRTYSPRRSLNQWQDLINHWEQSGQTIKQFCRTQGISEASFYLWRKRLSDHSLPTTSKQREASEPAFIDLGALDAANQGRWEITLSLGNGVELKLSQA